MGVLPRNQESNAPGEASNLHVVATAGHVDHGKSALILRLTGTDPDRFEEEKRRGLTIDLGFAWTTLPSGREIGFVDVPGHERFIRNMLAGVGPLRLVLFAVAADEGWKRQSEEHLQIVDVLGVNGAVVALTKADLVDQERLDTCRAQVLERLAGTRLEGAPIAACSARSGTGMDELVRALDSMVQGAPAPEAGGRSRQFIDRVFTIKGAGTVVTGTLAAGGLRVGDEVEILPSGHLARIRGLQTHKRRIEEARPVSRVAVNLSGTTKRELERGDVLVSPGRWRGARVFDALVIPVRDAKEDLESRGAYKIHAGAAEADARIRLHTESGRLRPGDQALARITASRPLVLDLHDRFVIRDSGRNRTVGGGEVLDVDPPRKWDARHHSALAARRETADRRRLAELFVDERGIVRAAEVSTSTGSDVSSAELEGIVRLGAWLASAGRLDEVSAALDERLQAEHRDHPLSPGLELAEARAFLARMHPLLSDPSLVDEVLARLESRGHIARTAHVVRLRDHRPTSAGRPDADRLVAALEAADTAPPTVPELSAAGFGRELIDAVCSDGRLTRISAELVMTPSFVARAKAVVESSTPSGFTVSEFREKLGTSRKYAVPLLEHFDAIGITRREGDRRFPRARSG